MIYVIRGICFAFSMLYSSDSERLLNNAVARSIDKLIEDTTKYNDLEAGYTLLFLFRFSTEQNSCSEIVRKKLIALEFTDTQAANPLSNKYTLLHQKIKPHCDQYLSETVCKVIKEKVKKAVIFKCNALKKQITQPQNGKSVIGLALGFHGLHQFLKTGELLRESIALKSLMTYKLADMNEIYPEIKELLSEKDIAEIFEQNEETY